MKKLLISIGLCLTTISVMGQSHQVQSFLNVRSVAVTNTSPVTNLTGAATFLTTWTNGVLTFYTNNAGTRLGTTNGAAGTQQTAGSTFNLLRDCNLWTDRNGNPPHNYFVSLTTTNYSSGASVYVRGLANSGTVGTLTFTFRPIYDGNLMENNTTKDFTFTYVPVASSVVAIATNVPMYLWPGAKGIRLLSIVNSSGNANADVNLLNVSLVGFVP